MKTMYRRQTNKHLYHIFTSFKPWNS